MAATQETSADSSGDTRSYAFQANANKLIRTEVGKQLERAATKLFVAPAECTEVALAGEFEGLRHRTSDLPRSTTYGSEPSRSIDGVVSSYDEASVKCRIRLINGEVVAIQLPRALFPDVIFYGLPIRLEMIDDHGIHRPSITIREANTGNSAAIETEFNALLDRL